MSAVVLLDPGHGGNDGGAIVSVGGVTVREADLVLDYSFDIAQKLHDLGAAVFKTRTSPSEFPSLQDRVYVAKVLEPDAFVSVHANAAGAPAAQGLEVLYATVNAGGYALADSICTSVDAAQITRVRGSGKPRKDSDLSPHGRLYVLRKNPAPAALVELGFLTNELDLGRLQDPDWKEQMTQAIAQGVWAFVGA